jgi:hypothetical protein
LTEYTRVRGASPLVFQRVMIEVWSWLQHQRRKDLSAILVVCCQGEVSSTGWSLVHRSPTRWVCVCARSWILDNEEGLAH